MPPRIRQVVLAARELDPVVARLRSELSLGEPFSDPGVGHFGLHNAVFALGDTFLEVVSPVRDNTAAGRLLDRRGDDCGYMVMFQVDDLAAARARVSAAGVREVFEVSLDDIEEVHLHPGDMRGAIVSLSRPKPAAAWRWGGPDWDRRSTPAAVGGVKIAVSDPDAVATRWQELIGGLPGVSFIADEADAGPVEITITGRDGQATEIGGVRFVCAPNEED